MSRRRRNRADAEIDVTSFSDIAFLLIIFFILTTTFVRPFGHKMEIPAGTSDPANKDETIPTVVLRGNKILYGEKGEEVGMEMLRLKLDKEQFKKKPEAKRLVVVECTKDVPYERYFEVVMAITDAGAGMALLEDEEAKKP